MRHKSLILLLIGSMFFCLLNSCWITTPHQQWIEGEFKYYGIRDNDTILDMSANQSEAVPIIATSANHLHFYLAENKEIFINRKWTEKSLKNLQKGYHTTNIVTFERVDQINDSICLRHNSVDKVTCRFASNLDGFDTIISEFRRVLKIDGEIILIQKLFEREISIKETSQPRKWNHLPNEKSLVAYIETKGFELVKSQQILFNDQTINDHSKKFALSKQCLFIFRKK